MIMFRDYLIILQSLADILVEELHNHLYLKSLYCNERWKAYSSKNGIRSNTCSCRAVANRVVQDQVLMRVLGLQTGCVSSQLSIPY